MNTRTHIHSSSLASRSDARSAILNLIEASSVTQGQSPVITDFNMLNNSNAHQLIKRGISSQTLGPLGDFLGLGRGLIAQYLDLDRSTANRRSSKGQLLPTHCAEGVLRLLELDAMASDVFETEEESSQWLRRPHPMLEGDTPLEAAKTSFGAQRVKDILLSIKYGGVV